MQNLISYSGLIEFYRTSYIWYSAIGSCLTVLIGLIISFLSGPQDPRKLNPKLISPAVDGFVRWLLSDDILYTIGWELGVDVEVINLVFLKLGPSVYLFIVYFQVKYFLHLYLQLVLLVFNSNRFFSRVRATHAISNSEKSLSMQLEQLGHYNVKCY